MKLSDAQIKIVQGKANEIFPLHPDNMPLAEHSVPYKERNANDAKLLAEAKLIDAKAARLLLDIKSKHDKKTYASVVKHNLTDKAKSDFYVKTLNKPKKKKVDEGSIKKKSNHKDDKIVSNDLDYISYNPIKQGKTNTYKFNEMREINFDDLVEECSAQNIPGLNMDLAEYLTKSEATNYVNGEIVNHEPNSADFEFADQSHPVIRAKDAEQILANGSGQGNKMHKPINRPKPRAELDNYDSRRKRYLDFHGLEDDGYDAQGCRPSNYDWHQSNDFAAFGVSD